MPKYSKEFRALFAGEELAKAYARFVKRKLRQFEADYLLTQGPVLDLGCGVGTITAALQNTFKYAAVMGIDGNSLAVEATRRVNKIRYVVQAVFPGIPLKDSSVPVVFSRGIYSIFNEETFPEIAREIYRILSAGGIYFAHEKMEKYKGAFIETGLGRLEEKPSYVIFRKNNLQIKRK